MSTRIERIGEATLYLGDCLEILPTLGAVDAVVTDPPYGINFTGKRTKHTDASGSASYVDTEQNFFERVLPAVRLALSIADRAAVFTGVTRLFDYPRPTDIGGIVCPNGGGMSAWGFRCYHPVAFYGTSPYLARSLGSRPNAVSMYHPGMHVTGERVDHPCAKPIQFMQWCVNAASLHGQLVIDPFVGSGTTGVACANLGRKFIGIEIDPKYFDIACTRVDAAYRQGRLFA